MRSVPFIVVVVVAAGCRLLDPPCGQLQKLVCQMPPEGELCSLMMNLPRGNDRIQTACEATLPAARLVTAEGTEENQELWRAASAKLSEFLQDPNRGRSMADKLKAHGGNAGRAVEDLEEANRLGEERRTDEAEAVHEAAED